MDYPIVGVAYKSTKQGDSILQAHILNKEVDKINFINEHEGKSKVRIKYRDLTIQELYGNGFKELGDAVSSPIFRSTQN